MIEDEISLLDKISDYYGNTILKELKSKKKEIQKVFNILIEKEAKKFNLVSENSVHNSRYVQVISRVKKKNSFREKLIRRNIGSKIINNLKLTEQNFDRSKAKISNEVENLDDVIGLRLVCDLNKDCPGALEMISNNLGFLKEHKISFKTGEIESQPQKMKNGLSIYRLKGVFDDRIGFELQIKSKIDEAWGELDHFIFYKDYSFFPSKTSVQQTMNNVGKLLDKIEDLLYDLRRSKDDYNKNLKNLLFTQELSEAYSSKIKDILGFSYQVEKLAPTLRFFIENYYPTFNIKDEENSEMSFKFLKYETSNENYKYYRNRSIELKLIEAIYINVWECETKQKLTSENYKKFSSHLCEALLENIKEEILQADTLSDYDQDLIENNFNLLIKFNSNENPWISGRLFSEFSKIRREVLDFISENFESEMEDEILGEDEIEQIYSIFLLCQFDANLEEFLDNLTERNYTQQVIIKLKEKYSNSISLNIIEKKINVFSLQILNHLAI
ncbi:hypothetical protein [Zunongwangia endophytica]|uniref:RelA/SpoT domain-containing protein n=1 Tax=Zunongwangia endophytica TaxID=1808945 RepID=A0ABV8H8P5_9FLAO|nr:hypothetical protein [Zunongwangia endophytica]MDN3594396.1 hypothetical protein [Zunongwangia endophytica]